MTVITEKLVRIEVRNRHLAIIAFAVLAIAVFGKIF